MQEAGVRASCLKFLYTTSGAVADMLSGSQTQATTIMQNRSTQSPRMKSLRTLMIGAALALSAAAHAGATTVGSPFPAMALTDQNDKPVNLPGSARWLVFVNEKAVDEWADPVIAALGQNKMNADRLVYISDISRMPSMITRLFALPKMRKRGYSIALIRDEKTAAQISARDGCAMLIGLKGGAVGSEEAVCNAGELKAKLGGLKTD